MSGELERERREPGACSKSHLQQQQQQQLQQQQQQQQQHQQHELEPQQQRQRAPPIGRSATVQSGSLQDLKLSNSSRWQQRLTMSSRHSSTGANCGASAPGRQPLRRQRSSNQSTPAPNQRAPSSRSMLLLAQNQHIPQAAAQIDSYIQKQQGDFMATAMQYAVSGGEPLPASVSNQSLASHNQAEVVHVPQLMSHHGGVGGIGGIGGGGGGGGGGGSKLRRMATLLQDSPSGCGAGLGSGLAPSATTVNTRSSSEQCNEQDQEDRPNCYQIMKRLFFSFLLCTIIAICWVMIIHTLKWVAIRGHEPFEGGASVLGGSGGNQMMMIGGVSGGASSVTVPMPMPMPQPMPTLTSLRRVEANLQQTFHSQVAPALEDKHDLSKLRMSEQQSAAAKRDQMRRRKRRSQNPNDDKSSSDKSANSYQTIVAPDQSATSGSAMKAKRQLEEISSGGNLEESADDDSSSGADMMVSTGAAMTMDEEAMRSDFARQRLPAKAAASIELGPPLKDTTNWSSLNKLASDQQQPSRKRVVQFGSGGGVAPQQSGHNLANSQPISINNDQLAAGQSVASMGDQQGLNNNQPNEASEESGGTAGGLPDQSVPQLMIETRGTVHAQVASYRAPFFTSWFVSIWNILFMPVFTLISSCCFRNEDSSTKKLLVESISQFMDNGLTTLQFLGRCAFFSFLWIATIFGIVYSLNYIDATVVMALFACSAALVYLLSWVLLHQQFVGVRIVAVIICTTGIALLAYMDNSSRTLGSVLMVAGSALCSAVYKVIYQRMFGFWSIAQMSLFFTLIGLFNAFLMWPVALLLYFLGVELIVWRYIPWIHLTAAGALHLTANILAYFGPICTYDIFLTLGLLLAVVLSAVIDVSFYKITFTGMKLAGVLLLMIGFLVCLLPENWNEYLYDLVNERFTRWKKQRSLKKSRNKVQDLSTGQMSRLRTPSGRVK